MTIATSLACHRTRALQVLYAYTLVGAGSVGVWLLLAPASFAAAVGMREPDAYTLGIVGAVYAGFAVFAVLGLIGMPEAVAPIFYLQLVYKTLWLLAVFMPRAIHGDVPAYAWLLAGVFVTYVALDLVALPRACVRTPLRGTRDERWHAPPAR